MKLIIANRRGTNTTSIDLLTAACDKLGHELVEIDCDAEVPEFDPLEKYMLYRLPTRSLAAARTLFRRYMCVSMENFDYHFTGTGPLPWLVSRLRRRWRSIPWTLRVCGKRWRRSAVFL